MRNLKKVLSLALALVMLLGMMVVGAGAATSFKDDADIHNQEAVAVLVGMGIMKGRVDDATKEVLFDPTGTLTRAEAAKMIAQLDLGVQAADALVGNGTSPFSDVWSGYWAEGAIDYCVEQGYINGDGAGHFLPNNKVSSVEFGIMLLRLLGYDAKVEGLVGDQWATKGAALARKAGLTTSVAANTQPMTRDAMAQMAFNALTATLVEYNGLNVSIGDATFNTPATPRYHNENDVTDQDTYDGKKPTATTTIKFCEEHFPDLKLVTDSRDGFKREYSVWTWKNVDIAGSKVLVKADAEFTAKTTASDVSSAINGAKGARLDTPVYVNGKQVTTIAGTDVDADLIASWTENGRQVLVYLNETDHKQIKKVVVVDTFVAQVNSVGSDSITLNILSNTEKTMEPANAKVSALKNSDKVYVYNQTNLLAGSLTSRTVKATGFAAGDLVTYTAAYNNDTKKYTIVADDVAMLSDPVTGTLTAWRGSNLVNSSTGNSNSSFTVDSGDPYKYSINNVVVDSDNGAINIYEFAVNKSEINVYVDKYGYAIYVSGVEVAKNYAAVIGMGSSNQYGSETRGVTLLLPDGTTVEVTAKMSKADWAAMTVQPAGNPDAGKNLVTDGLADIVTYTVDDKGVYTLTRVALPRVSSPTADQYTGMYKVPTVKPVFTNGKSEMKIEGTPYYTTNRTIFMVGSQNSDKTYSYSVYTGYADAPSIVTETTVHGIAFGLNRNLTRQIDVVYIDASNLSNATGNEIYFAFNKNVAIDTTSNGSFITVPAVVDGKVEDITISATISKNWDNTGVKQLRYVETNDLYVIDSVVRNDAGIITNCVVKTKGENNDILKALPAYKQGIVRAGFGVVGFGQANEGDNIFWAYTENSKGYYVDKDYKTITETAIGNFATDKNDYVWANGDSVNKKVDTLFVVEVEGNEAPIVPSDNEVAITVDIDDGVKSVTVGTTKLTADGTVNVTKNTATDVTVELNDGYKVSKVTGAGNDWTSGEKFTIKTSITDTLKIETASTKGKTLTLAGLLGPKADVKVFVGENLYTGTINEETKLSGVQSTYSVPAGEKITIQVNADTSITATKTVKVGETNVKLAENGNDNTAFSDTIEFTMPEGALTLNLASPDTINDGNSPAPEVITITLNGGVTAQYKPAGAGAVYANVVSGEAVEKGGTLKITGAGTGAAVIGALDQAGNSTGAASVTDLATKAMLKSVVTAAADGVEVTDAVNSSLTLYSVTKVTVEGSGSGVKATATIEGANYDVEDVGKDVNGIWVPVNTELTVSGNTANVDGYIKGTATVKHGDKLTDDKFTLTGSDDVVVYGAVQLKMDSTITAYYHGGTTVDVAADKYVDTDTALDLKVMKNGAEDTARVAVMDKAGKKAGVAVNNTSGVTLTKGDVYKAYTKVTLDNMDDATTIGTQNPDWESDFITQVTKGSTDEVFGVAENTIIKVTGKADGTDIHVKVGGKGYGAAPGVILSEDVGSAAVKAAAVIKVADAALVVTQAA